MRRILDLCLNSRAVLAVPFCLVLTLPLLLVRIPPLTDLPGHMGSSAVAAYAGDPVFARFMSFRWHLVPNLGTDLIVAALQGGLGITRATWLVALALPPLIAAGIFALARTLNARGAAASPWALLFVYSFPLNNGFLNYMLGVGLSLIGFSAWMRLDPRPRLREVASWIVVPLVFLCHVVAGCMLVLFIASREYHVARQQKQAGHFLARVRPLLSAVIIILFWRLDAQSFAGHNRITLTAKLHALVMMLRDQNIVLDVGSILLAIGVFVLGWRNGARPHRAVVPALLCLMLLFVVTPSMLSGSSYADARLLPLIPMLAFATQDYSRVDRRLAGLVAMSGLALLAVRLTATVAGFAAYDTRYSTELQALEHVPEHSRLLVLDGRDCDWVRRWRGDRLDHLGELAIVYRRSWTNSEWDIDGGHLLQVRYRPSTRFYDDPSQYVWKAACGGLQHRRPTMQDALALVPFDGIDDLWLIGAALPSGYDNPRLVLLWRQGGSSLYAVRPPGSHGG